MQPFYVAQTLLFTLSAEGSVRFLSVRGIQLHSGWSASHSRPTYVVPARRARRHLQRLDVRDDILDLPRVEHILEGRHQVVAIFNPGS